MAHRLNLEILESANTPKKCLQKWFDTELKLICNQTLKRGCLIVNSLIERTYQDEEVLK